MDIFDSIILSKYFTKACSIIIYLYIHNNSNNLIIKSYLQFVFIHRHTYNILILYITVLLRSIPKKIYILISKGTGRQHTSFTHISFFNLNCELVFCVFLEQLQCNMLVSTTNLSYKGHKTLNQQ